MARSLKEYYTFLKDLRPFGNGTPVAYKYDPTAFSGDLDMASGEFAAFDATNRRVVRYLRNGGAGNFIGISRDSALGMLKLGNQPALALTELSVFTSGVHSLLGKSAETYVHGTAVYMDATNTQAITTVAGGGTQIGAVYLPGGESLSGAVRVPVLIDGYAKMAS
jgi:hypothetical protein